MKITNYLQQKGVRFDVLPHAQTFDAQHMAHALHVPGRHVAKTVLFKADGGFGYVLAIVPATHRVDVNKTSKALGGSRLEMAAEEELADNCPDCEVGVLPPFGSQYGMRTIVDERLSSDDWIVFEGNTHREAIRMKFADFQRLESPLMAKISGGAMS